MECDLYLPLDKVEAGPTLANPSPINNSLTPQSTLAGDTVADGEFDALETLDVP
jgi:hypothetical protein